MANKPSRKLIKLQNATGMSKQQALEALKNDNN